MSSNPQWKSFQPPTLNDTSIMDFKALAGPTPCPYSRMHSNGLFSNHGHPHHPAYGDTVTVKDLANNLFGNSVSNNYTNYNVYGSGTSSNGSMGRFPIGTYTGTENNDIYNGSDNMLSQNSSTYGINNVSSNSSYNNDQSSNNQGTRETGIIEKLLHSYGFIQCCERQARLFFHFSQFNGNIEHLKIGDPVEFEMTYDRRTGKPIASIVSKIAPEVVLSEERVTGTVTTELGGSSGGSSETQGRISYENRGECFFLPYTKDDVEGHVSLRVGDKVSFQIATNPRGNLGATHVRLENPAHPVKYQGVVCSMKDSFGFIERADVVKEIFFHFSEVQTKDELQVGDDVEFIIQTRNGKEVACNITTLAPGTVIFEDVDDSIVKGQVLKPLDKDKGRAHQQTDPLPGRIRYRAIDHSEVEVPFGEKDQNGEYTLRHGDWVQFNIATDRRDGLQRATHISVLPESFNVSGERRETGSVVALRDGGGFIRLVDREARVWFHMSELISPGATVAVGDELEFTIHMESASSFSNQRQNAIRIKQLPPGTVQFETIIERNLSGVVSKEAVLQQYKNSTITRSPSKNQININDKSPESGYIAYSSNGIKKMIAYFIKDCDFKNLPKCGDKVEFNISQVKRNKELMAVDIKIFGKDSENICKEEDCFLQNGTNDENINEIRSINSYQQENGLNLANAANSNGYNESDDAVNSQINTKNIANNTGSTNYIPGQICRGFIAALKDSFGFIETVALDMDIFFHYSNFDGDPVTLELGSEVEYTVANSSHRSASAGHLLSAENVITLPKGTLMKQFQGGEEIFSGKVVRPLRSINPSQDEYFGIIVRVQPESNESGPEYNFGMMSFSNKRELLQVGDPVEFQITDEGRAVNIQAIRKKKKATVDSIKGQFGFLNFEPEEGKKLFFHMSEVSDGVLLQPGDTVEFVVVTNQRNAKSFACNVHKICEERPERLVSRLRTVITDESAGPRLIAIRSPRGPGEGNHQAFSILARRPRAPGTLVDS